MKYIYMREREERRPLPMPSIVSATVAAMVEVVFVVVFLKRFVIKNTNFSDYIH